MKLLIERGIFSCETDDIVLCLTGVSFDSKRIAIIKLFGNRAASLPQGAKEQISRTCQFDSTRSAMSDILYANGGDDGEKEDEEEKPARSPALKRKALPPLSSSDKCKSMTTDDDSELKDAIIQSLRD